MNLVRQKPRRWSELKKITGLSSATLYRYLTKLEESKSIEQVLRRKRLQWKITRNGEKRAVSKSLSEFFRMGTEFDFDVRLVFDYWQPRQVEDEAMEEKPEDLYSMVHPKDREFAMLRRKEMMKSIVESLGDKGIDQFRKASPGLYIGFVPKAIILKRAKDGNKLGGLLKEITLLLEENKEEIISWLLPKRTTKYNERNFFTNEALILLKINFEVDEEIIDEVLKKPSGPTKLKGQAEKKK